MKNGRTAAEQTEYMRNLLAFLLVGAFISVLPLLMWWVIPEQNKEIFTYMAGQLSGMATLALGFYFVNKVGQDALDATRATNTGKVMDLAASALKAGGSLVAVNDAADAVAGAAVDEAEKIKGD